MPADEKTTALFGKRTLGERARKNSHRSRTSKPLLKKREEI